MVTSDIAGERLFAIGDLHGDYSKAKAALQLAGLLNEEGYWSGGKARLVQLGDLMDRGAYSLDCINLFERLKVSPLWRLLLSAGAAFCLFKPLLIWVLC